MYAYDLSTYSVLSTPKTQTWRLLIHALFLHSASPRLCILPSKSNKEKKPSTMSLASPSFPSIKVKVKVAPSSHSWKPYHRHLTIRNSKADGPLRRPAAPSLSAPPSLTPPRKPTEAQPTSPSPTPPPPSPAPATVAAPKVEGDLKGVVTLEYQRKVARELQEYFKQKKLEEADQGPAFGFTAKNEISNGRWAMFGFAVGLLTEFATGSDFVQQMKILLSNFGIVDLD